jgi:hypothetical protein
MSPVSVWRGLFFQQDLHPVRGSDLDDPVGPVLVRPLNGHLEAQARPLAGSDRLVRIADTELPGQARCCRIGARTAAETEFNIVVANRDEARVLGALVGRAQAQQLIETALRVGVLDMRDRYEPGDQVAHGPDGAVASRMNTAAPNALPAADEDAREVCGRTRISAGSLLVKSRTRWFRGTVANVAPRSMTIRERPLSAA